MKIKMIGNKIVKARKEKNISQAQLAQLLFISPQAVGKWERGESVPDIITTNRLAEALGVDLNYFSESVSSNLSDAVSTESLSGQPAGLPFEKHEKRHFRDMSRGNWVDADFSGLKNLHEQFSYANMQRCKFIGSAMSGLVLKGNRVEGCDFSGSDIGGSCIQSSHLADNVFKAVLMKDAEFSETHIKTCDLSNADLTGATFKSSGFVKNVMSDTLLNHTTFAATQIADVVFNGELADCHFENCAFSRVTFQNAKLINSFFKNKTLKGIKFIDCYADRLTYEFLKSGKADLNGITLLTA